MHVVTGVTGRTGAAAAAALLAAGQSVRVVVRSGEKGEAWVKSGAEFAIADFNDRDAMTAALDGAKSAYLMTPPLAEAENLLAAREPIDAALVNATKAAKVGHVVVLSSVGAHLPSGTGQIVGLHRLENKFEDAGLNFTALRAAFFMENWTPLAIKAKDSGSLLSFLDPADLKIEQVSTGDIGIAVADLMQDPVKGKRVVEMAGPETYSAADAAAALGETLGRTIEAMPIPRENWAGIWAGMGWSKDRCRLYTEFFDGLNAGHVAFSGEGETRRGSDSLSAVMQKLPERVA